MFQTTKQGAKRTVCYIVITMRIFFDFEVQQTKSWDDITTAQQVALETIHNYVYDRIAILEEQTNLEENGTHAFIHIVPQKPIRIEPIGYSESLTKQILESFNENDGQLLWEQVEQSLVGFLN